MINSKLVAVTTVRQGDPKNIVEKVRAEIFLDTVTQLRLFNIPCVALYTECSAVFLRDFADWGVTLIRQTSQGMGNIRREVQRAALSLYSEASYYLWLEPEKCNIPRFAHALCQQMVEKQALLGLFNRVGMQTYPPEQAYYYLFCRAVASRLVGFDFDYGFGPMILTKESMSYFLSYDGRYGDLWDSILIPRLKVIKDGLPIEIYPCNFINDPRMKAVETGNNPIILKRVQQLMNVVPSLIKEWERLSQNQL